MTIQDDVTDSLKRGTGRALLIIRDNQDTDFSEIIFNACVNALGYDLQCEGNRAKYLYEIVQSSRQNLLLEQKLTEAILSEKIEGWDLTQLFGLVKIFAEKGNKTARENLYKRFSLSEYEDCQGSGISDELIDLDGLEALKFIAEVRGKELLKSETDWEDSYLLTYTRELIPESNPLEYLEEVAISNQHIQTYLSKIKECEGTISKRSEDELTYEVVKEKIGKGYGSYILRRASQEIILMLAEDFINEKDVEIAKNYLKAFQYHKFPLNFNYLIPFTKDSDDMTRYYALQSLGFFQDSQLREIALTNLNQRVDISGSLKILANNFEQQDYKLIEQIIHERYEDRSDEMYWLHEDFHEIAWRVNDIYEKNKSVLLLNALVNLYTLGHCSICRKKPLELMIRDRILPDWIRNEAVYDCNFDIRELFI
jgi:hypothetical protein